MLAALGVLPSSLAAQDIFIKPKNDSGTHNTQMPDLGVRARPAAPPSQQPTQPAQPQPPAIQESGPAATAQPEPAIAQPVTPTPPPVTAPQDYSDDTSSGIKMQRLATGADLMIVPDKREKMPVGQGPNKLSLSLQPGAVGQSDKQMIASLLGLSEQEVMGNCFFEYQAISSYTNGGGEILPLGTAPSASVRFPAALQSVDIYPTIACRKLRTPLSGMIVEQGNYYKVGIFSVNCPADAARNSGAITLIFRYLGDGTGECKYQ